MLVAYADRKRLDVINLSVLLVLDGNIASQSSWIKVSKLKCYIWGLIGQYKPGPEILVILVVYNCVCIVLKQNPLLKYIHLHNR